MPGCSKFPLTSGKSVGTPLAVFVGGTINCGGTGTNCAERTDDNRSATLEESARPRVVTRARGTVSDECMKRIHKTVRGSDPKPNTHIAIDRVEPAPSRRKLATWSAQVDVRNAAERAPHSTSLPPAKSNRPTRKGTRFSRSQGRARNYGILASVGGHGVGEPELTLGIRRSRRCARGWRRTPRDARAWRSG